MRLVGFAAVALVVLTLTRGARGEEEARPPPPPPLETSPPAWERHIEVGGDVAFVTRLASADDAGNATDVRYGWTVGYGVHGRWDVLRFLRFTAYFVSARHDVALPPGALGLRAKLSLDSVSTYSFGAKLSPTIPWSARARSWISVGGGWGRLEFGKMRVTEGASAFTVKERSASFVEIPLGLGTSFDIIPSWLSIELEVTGAFALGQEGDALREVQAIDAQGRRRAVSGFPELDATFVQTLGLSLIL